MNILYISNKKRWGGIVSWMEKTALLLNKRGHKVWVFSHPNSLFTKKGSPDLAIIPFKIGFDYNLISLLKLIFFIKKNKINLLVTNIKKEVVIGTIASRFCKIPHIRRIGTDSDYDHTAVQKIYKKGYIDSTISPCKYMNHSIIAKYDFIDEKNMYHIYNGRNITKYAANELEEIKQKYNLPEKKILIGSICQLSKTKNLAGAIRVFAEVKKKYPDIHFVIAGDGPERENLILLQKEFNLEKDISFLGFVKDTQKLAASLDIGILFSYNEGFSNSIVEMMSVGLPVICSDVGGQKEIIENEKNGYLIEPGNEEELEEKLEFLIDNVDKRKEMGLKAIETVKLKFSEDRMVEELEDLYEKTIYKYNK